VLGLAFDEQWLPGPGEMAFLTPFADACAQAVRRLNAAHAAGVRQRQLRFLADVSLELGRSLDYRATLRRVAELVVPDLADWCTVQILDDGQLITLAVAHADPAKVRWAWQLQERFPPPQDAPSGAPAVVRTGISELYPEITDDLLLAGARDGQELQLLRQLGMRSALVAPLTARGRTFGAITLIRTRAGRDHYGPDDLQIAEDLGRRAGLAIDNGGVLACL
jgi:GAF domain-containing protein